jgi:hypothetical protein
VFGSYDPAELEYRLGARDGVMVLGSGTCSLDELSLPRRAPGRRGVRRKWRTARRGGGHRGPERRLRLRCGRVGSSSGGCWLRLAHLVLLARGTAKARWWWVQPGFTGSVRR